MLKLDLRLLLTLPLLVAACHDKVVSLDEVTQTQLDATGGRALSAGGELTVAFAAGTLTANSVVTIRTDRKSAVTGLASPAVDLTVEPPAAAFDPPVALTIDVGPNGREVAIVNLDTGAPITVASSTYDAVTGEAHASLTHFSRYAAVGTVPSNACPASFPSGACTTPDLRCEYGQECCCGRCHPERVATCSGGQWAGMYTDACLGAALCTDAGTPTCPANAPTGACTDEGLTCEYGEECCCGQCSPSIVSTCSGGRWATRSTDACLRPACPDAGPAACPASLPSGGCADEGLTCEYGEECCCGQCFPSLVATCSGGQWGAHNTDACLRPACPDAG